MSTQFGRALVGNSFAEAREKGEYLSIEEMEKHLLQEFGNTYQRFRDSKLSGKIFNEFCAHDCQNNGKMNFLPESGAVAHFKRMPGYCKLRDGDRYDCPAHIEDYNSESYQYHSFTHYLVIDKRGNNQNKARHFARLPPLLEEDWGHELEGEWDSVKARIKRKFNEKYDHSLTQIDDGLILDSYSDWKFSTTPLGKTDARVRENRFKIHLPSLRIPTWFLFKTEDANTITYKYRHDVGKKATCTIPHGSPSAILYLPKEFGREDQLRGFLNDYQEKVNTLEFMDGGGIDSSNGTLLEFDFRRPFSFDYLAKQDMWSKVYDDVTTIMHRAKNPSRNANNNLTNSITRHFPREIRKEKSSFNVIWYDQTTQRLRYTRDGELKKISFSGRKGLLGILFTVAKKEEQRMVTVTRHTPKPKQLEWAFDNGRGVIWIQLTGEGYQQFTLQSTEDSSPVPIELNAGKNVSNEPSTKIEYGHKFAPNQDLISQLLNSLAQDDFSHIDTNILNSIEILETKSSDSILSEVIRWAFGLAEEENQAYVSNISRKARLAWYLLQQKYLDVGEIKAMSTIVDLLKKMPEFMRLPPTEREGRWNRWTKRRDYVDLEAINADENLKMFVSAVPFNKLPKDLDIQQDGHGRRWISRKQIPSGVSSINFDHVNHPYTAKLSRTPSEWFAEVISIIDLAGGWEPMESFQWADDSSQTVVWTGSKEQREHERMIEPRQVGQGSYGYGDFNNIKNMPHPFFSRNKDYSGSPYVKVGERKFSMLFRFRSSKVGNKYHDYDAFISEYNEDGKFKTFSKFGSSGITTAPEWLKGKLDENFMLDDKNLTYLFDPDDVRYFERETLKAIHLLYLKAIGFKGLDPDNFMFGRKGYSSEIYDLFNQDESNRDDVVFKPVYSGQYENQIKKRLLKRLGWWFDEN